MKLIWAKQIHFSKLSSLDCIFFTEVNFWVYSDNLTSLVASEFYPKPFNLENLFEKFEKTHSQENLLNVSFSLLKAGILISKSPETNLNTEIQILWSGKLPQNAITEVLPLNLRVSNTSNESKCPTVLFIDDFINLDTATWSNIKSKSILLAKPVGLKLLLGPYLDLTKNLNFELFKSRLVRNYLWKEILRKKHGRFELESDINIGAWSTLATQIPSFLKGTINANTIIEFDVKTFRINRIKVPNNLLYRSSKESFVYKHLDNRPFNTKEIHKKLIKHQAPIIGLLKKTASKPSPLGGWVGEGGLVYRSNKVSLETSFGKSRASGNGITQAAAEAGAFCETLERYSSIFRDNDAFIIDSFENLKKLAIHPNTLSFYSENQYSEKEMLSLIPFETEAQIAWSEIKTPEGKTKLMPTQLLYIGGPKKDINSQKYFSSNTNGTAAGSSPTHAKLLALYELIERDAVHIWWYNKLPAPSISLNKIKDELVHIIAQKHKEAEETLLFLDISQDIAVKTVAAVSSYSGDRYFIAAGSDVDIEKACAKAARELSQLYFYFSNNKHLGWPRNDKSLVPFFLKKPQNVEIVESPLFENLSDELVYVESCILNQNLAIYYKDLSRQDVELSVYKAIVPTMRNQYRQLSQGRLYDVPEKLYGIKTSEKDLNPFNLN